MEIGNVKIWKIFGMFILLYCFNIILLNGVITEKIYVNSFTGQLSAKMIGKVLSIKVKYAWLNYYLIPVLLLIKTGFVAVCFWIGSFIGGLKLTFKDYLRPVLFAETVFIIFSFIQTGFLYYNNFQTLTEIGQFQPFALYYILNVNNIPAYLNYPLALVSIPEAIYWVVLVLLLKPLISGNFWKRLGFVAKTYGVGLLVWVSIVVFVTLNFSA